MRSIKKILIEHKTGVKYYVKDLEVEFHTNSGVISKKDLNSKQTEVETNKGKKFTLLNPNFADLWANLKRGPQIMQQKDIGLILAKTGINKNSRVVDAGGGSGSLCLSLANVCKEITVYEINPEHFDVVQKNAKAMGISNITLKQESIYNGIKESNIDIVTLDLPEPWQAIKHAENCLVNAGHLIVYLPNLHQVKTFLDSCRGSKIKVAEILELLQRKWKITDKIMRPEFEMLGHTGFMVFCRKA